MKPSPEILIIRPGALGDTLMLLPALYHLKKKYRLFVAARRPGLTLLGPWADACLDFEGRGWHLLFEDSPERGEFPSGLQPERVVAFLRDREGLVERNLHILFPKAEIGVFYGYPEKGEKVHAAFHLARCCAETGLAIEPETCLAEARESPLLRGFNAKGRTRARGGLVIHPGSGGKDKNLSLEFWLRVVEVLPKMLGPRALPGTTFVLGPAEEGLAEGLTRSARDGNLEVVLSPDMGDLCRVLGSASLYAGHDSGVTHLSAMLGTPTIALFRASDPQVWGPLGPRVRILDGTGDEGVVGEELIRVAHELMEGGEGKVVLTE